LQKTKKKKNNFKMFIMQVTKFSLYKIYNFIYFNKNYNFAINSINYKFSKL